MQLTPFFPLLFFLSAGALAVDLEFPELGSLRLNEVQYIGTHNSYHIEPDQSVDLVLLVNKYGAGSEWPAARLVRSLAYTHYPLDAQLRLGIRAFELDIYPDPSGGLYAEPGIYKSIAASGLIADVPYDPDGLMRKPGFKVLHMQDLDVRSNCKLLSDCLRIVNGWSDSVPNHVPIVVIIEPKEKNREPVDGNYKPVAVPTYTREVLQELEAEILSVVPRRKIIAPDDIRGEGVSLKRAIRRQAWPTLAKLAGKILFVLTGSGKAARNYAGESRTLENRLMFANLGMKAPGSAFVTYAQPQKEKHRLRIGGALADGFLVRTRADANTEEARRSDWSTQRLAFGSGAQIVITDYPFPDHRLSGYRTQFENGMFVRCNPVTAKGKCNGR